MEVTRTIAETRRVLDRVRVDGRSVALVPTMGALHDGHISLVRNAITLPQDSRRKVFVTVSIFVNPTQFGPSEDFEKYPRNVDCDAERCMREGVDLIFAPSAREMYPEGFNTWVEVAGLADRFEGAVRPGHFRGVTTVCAKLFNIVQPDRAYFGMKDYQQLKVIQKMVRDLNMPLEIVPIETVREPDGLAMSSRNAYLSPSERSSALVLSRALAHARSLFDSGERRARCLQEEVAKLILGEPGVRMDYAEVVDAESLEPIDTITRAAVVLIAARVGNTRLIDNTVLS